MNLLVVSTDFPPNKGGISTYTIELATALGKKNKVTVLAPGSSMMVMSNIAYSIRIIRTPSLPLIRLAAFFFYIPWILKRYSIDAVLHTIWLTSLGSYLWYFMFPVPYFISVHASEILDDKRTSRRRIKMLLKRWKLSAIKKARGIFPVSNYSAKLLSKFSIEPAKTQVISNGVNPQRFKPIKPCDPGSFTNTLLTVSRLDLHKGHDNVLKALSILKKQGFVPNYIIVGEGEEELRLRKITKRLGLERQVKFAGFIQDDKLPEIYASADIFIMASREIPGRNDLIEGFGISFLEASASGLPVIAGDSGGVSDALLNEKTGFLVNPNDPYEIAKAIRLLITNPALCTQIGKQGRKWTESQMNWEIIAERMQNAIRNLM